MTEVAQGILSKYIEKGFGSCCRTETGLLERPYNGSLLKHAETKADYGVVSFAVGCGGG